MKKEEAIQRFNGIINAMSISIAQSKFYPSKAELNELCDMAIEALQFVEHFDLLKEYQSLQEVVRCKDCRHWYEKMNKCNRCPSISGNWEANDFCSYGERKKKINEK